jgi:homoserine kinase
MFCELQEQLPELGAFGCTLSGAGPSTLVWVPAERSAEVAARVAALLPHAVVSALAPEPRGVLISATGD